MNMKVFVALLIAGLLGGSGAGYLVLEQRKVTPPPVERSGESSGESPAAGETAPETAQEPAPATKAFTPTGTLGGFRIGDCYIEGIETPLSKMTLVPCTEEHRSEVVGAYTFTTAFKYEESAEITESLRAGCVESILEYLDEVSDKAPINMHVELYPQVAQGDPKGFLCLLGERGGPSKRSLKGVSL